MYTPSYSENSTPVNAKFLSKAHQEQIEQRGLLNGRARANCRSITAEEASLTLGFPAKSGGILIEGDSLQSQFRPDKPWKLGKEKVPPKYLTPLTDHGCDAILPSDPEQKDYWEPENLKKICYQINGHPYLLITEGGFKAIAGCDNNLPTIGLMGVEMGLTGKDKDVQGKRYLIPSLEKYAKAGLGLIIAFDADAATNPNINWAQRKLGHQLLKFNVPVYIATGLWDMGENGETKGMDDFIKKREIEEFRQILARSIKFEDWEAKTFPKEDGLVYDSSDPDSTRPQKKEKAPTLPSANNLADELAEIYREKLAWESEFQLWRQYGAEYVGCWDITTEETVRGLIHAHLRSLEEAPAFNSGYVSSVLTILKSDLETRKWNQQPGLIPLRDGVLNQKTLELTEHAPGYKLTWQLPFKWADRGIGCAPIEEFLLKISGHPDIAEVLLAYLAAIVTGRADLQRYLELIGGGGTGKSTYMALAKALIGGDNAVSSQLKLLESNQFETARFYQKKLILFPDSERWMGEISVLKQLTGQDPIRYERKGVQQCRDFAYEGMVILSANEAPQSSDRTSGQERRKLTIELDTRCPEYEGRELAKEFALYLPGLLARVLSIPSERITELVKHSDKNVPALSEKKWSQLCETNPIAEWLNERAVSGENFKTYIGTNDPDSVGKWLYANFCQFQAQSGCKQSIPNKRFSNNLKDLLKNQLKLSIKEGRDRDGSYIEGIGLRCLVDPGNKLPRPVTKTSFCDGFVTDGDGSVTAESLTDVGCDGFDGFLENPEKPEENFDNISQDNVDKKNLPDRVEKNPSNPSHPSLPGISAVTNPSQTRHKPVTSPKTPKTPREYEVDDQVVVADRDAGIYKDAIGVVTDVCYTRSGQELRVTFEKPVRGVESAIFTASQLMCLRPKA